MIQLEEKTLQSFLYKAKEAAIQLQKQQLFSWIKKITELDLLAVFQAAKDTGKDRSYWTNSANDFTVVGIGSTHKIINHRHHHRFEYLQNEWQQILADALVYNPYKEMGTGLM